MSKIQFIAAAEIKALMIRYGAIQMIKAGELQREEQDRRPAKSIPSGASIICNYYDQNGTHVATAHKLITPTGETAHCDAKRFVLASDDYRVTPKG